MIRYALLCLVFMSCSTNQPEIRWAGSFRKIMHDHDVSAKLELRTLKGQPQLYGIGAVDNLDGEIMIMNGEPLITKMENGRVRTDRSFDHKAALLVYASVSRWRSVEIPDDVRSLREIEEFVSAERSKNGLSDAVVFRIESNIDSLEGHIVNGPPAGGQAHSMSGHALHFEGRRMNLLGFFSESHYGEFLHHDSRVHMHFLTEDSLAGHVDDVILRKGGKLSLGVE